MFRWFTVLAIGAFASACGNCAASSTNGDSGPSVDASGASDASVIDSGVGPDAGVTADAGAADGSGGLLPDGGCYTSPVGPGSPNPAWATGSCPDAGCASGTTCLFGEGEFQNVYGCAPVPPECSGAPSCACMGCICARGGCSEISGVLTCPNGTISLRAFKDEVVYVGAAEREALARQALQIPLARYRYKGEPEGSRRRLGFLIDDQPDESPAVQADRTHVDEYGYTSLLLAAVQEQSTEIARLRQRIEQLERGSRAAKARCRR